MVEKNIKEQINQSFQVIEMGLNKATKKGSFNLTEVHQLLSALNYLKTNIIDK